MRMDDYIGGGKFIKVEDVRGGPRREVIAECRQGNFDSPDCEFQSGKILTLNKTNARTLTQAWGPESDNWEGKEVELYVGPITFKGASKDSVLLRPISPPTTWRDQPQQPKKTRQEELDDEIPF